VGALINKIPNYTGVRFPVQFGMSDGVYRGDFHGNFSRGLGFEVKAQ
jgi:hypothetical protein